MFDTKSYDSIFDLRGSSYHAAMELFPESRDEEFTNLFKACQAPDAGQHLVDMPSGGGYLRGYLSPDVRYTALETAKAFADRSGGLLCNWSQLPLEVEAVDYVVCCAAMHHVPDNNRQEFFAEALRILKPGGYLLMADVEAGSPQDGFLNVFVHNHNSMGHEGEFMTETFAETLPNGFDVIENKIEHFFWTFGPLKADAVRYVRCMFGLDKATDQQTETAIEKAFDLRRNEAGNYIFDWALRYLTTQKVA